MFLTTDVFFLSSGHQTTMVHTDKNSILWFSFCLHLKSHPQSEGYAPGHNHQFLKHSILIFFCLFRNWRRAFSWTWFSYVLLLSCFLLFLFDLLDGQLLILRQLHCHLPVSEFSLQWNSIRRKKRWKALHKPHTKIYPHFHSSQTNTNKYNWWRVLIFW